MSENEQELYEKYFEKVYKTTYYIIKNEEMAKDITQETFIKAFKNMKKIKDLTKVEPWIITIATRTAIDFYNKSKKQNVVEFIESNHTSKIVKWNDNNEEITRYLNAIKPEQKQILVLRYFEDLSEKEIAKCLKIKLGTVKSRLSRAKKKLLEEFQTGGVNDGRK